MTQYFLEGGFWRATCFEEPICPLHKGYSNPFARPSYLQPKLPPVGQAQGKLRRFRCFSQLRGLWRENGVPSRERSHIPSIQRHFFKSMIFRISVWWDMWWFPLEGIGYDMTLVIVWYGRCFERLTPWTWQQVLTAYWSLKLELGKPRSPLWGCNCSSGCQCRGSFPTKPNLKWFNGFSKSSTVGFFITLVHNQPQPGAMFELIASKWKHWASNGSESPSWGTGRNWSCVRATQFFWQIKGCRGHDLGG